MKQRRLAERFRNLPARPRSPRGGTATGKWISSDLAQAAKTGKIRVLTKETLRERLKTRVVTIRLAERDIDLARKQAERKGLPCQDGTMEQLHMNEAELARNLHRVLEQVRCGAEIALKEDHRRFALIRRYEDSGRDIDECIAIARARNSPATLDKDFAADLKEVLAARVPLDTSAWE